MNEQTNELRSSVRTNKQNIERKPKEQRSTKEERMNERRNKETNEGAKDVCQTDPLKTFFYKLNLITVHSRPAYGIPHPSRAAQGRLLTSLSFTFS
jgi:hypothetical protein